MAVNKVVFGTDTLMDISDSTVTPDTLLKDIIAYAANGKRIVGTAEAGGLPDGISALATGTFTLASNNTAKYKDVTHGLGVKPNFFFACNLTSYLPEGTCFSCIGIKRTFDTSIRDYAGAILYQYVNGAWYNGILNLSSYDTSAYFGDTTFRVTGVSYALRGGGTWFWVCGVIDGLV